MKLQGGYKVSGNLGFDTLLCIYTGGVNMLPFNPVYDLYLAVTLIWRFGGVALQPPIIMSACRRSDDSEEVNTYICDAA